MYSSSFYSIQYFACFQKRSSQLERDLVERRAHSIRREDRAIVHDNATTDHAQCRAAVDRQPAQLIDILIVDDIRWHDVERYTVRTVSSDALDRQVSR